MNTSMIKLRVWLGAQEPAGEEALEKGDLVSIHFTSNAPVNLMHRGEFGRGNSVIGKYCEAGEKEITVEVPEKFNYGYESRSIGTKKETFPLDWVSHVQFLARGYSAVGELFENIALPRLVCNQMIEQMDEAAKHLTHQNKF